MQGITWMLWGKSLLCKWVINEQNHCCSGPQLVQGLPHNHTLKTVHLYDNNLGLDGLKMPLQPFLQNVTNYQLTSTINNQNEGIPNNYACDIYKLDWHSTWLGQILSSSAKSLSCYWLPQNTVIVLGTLIIVMVLLGRWFLHQSWMCCWVNFNRDWSKRNNTLALALDGCEQKYKMNVQ